MVILITLERIGLRRHCSLPFQEGITIVIAFINDPNGIKVPVNICILLLHHGCSLAFAAGGGVRSGCAGIPIAVGDIAIDSRATHQAADIVVAFYRSCGIRSLDFAFSFKGPVHHGKRIMRRKSVVLLFYNPQNTPSQPFCL
jgi:hypothetical protein